uniref:hypothetical protein n=1 Tax=Gemmiger formicilis TaxID=745368 RepID=UPI003FEF7044
MGIFDTLQEESTFSRASGNNYNYVVLQVVLKEKFIGTGSGNLTDWRKSSMSRPQRGIACTRFLLPAAAAKA